MATRGLVLLAKDTFTSVSNAQFDNVFSATYKQYKIVVNVTGANVNAEYVTGGTPYTTGSYNRQVLEASSTTVSGSRTTGANFISSLAGNGSLTIMEILNPFQTAYTSAMTSTAENPTSTITINSRAHGISVTNSFDGINFKASSGTISGSITIYGLAQ